jgi:hypothetical protein
MFRLHLRLYDGRRALAEDLRHRRPLLGLHRQPQGLVRRQPRLQQRLLLLEELGVLPVDRVLQAGLPVRMLVVDLRFGRVVASIIEPPNLLVNLVYRGRTAVRSDKATEPKADLPLLVGPLGPALGQLLA